MRTSSFVYPHHADTHTHAHAHTNALKRSRGRRRADLWCLGAFFLFSEPRAEEARRNERKKHQRQLKRRLTKKANTVQKKRTETCVWASSISSCIVTDGVARSREVLNRQAHRIRAQQAEGEVKLQIIKRFADAHRQSIKQSPPLAPHSLLRAPLCCVCVWVCVLSLSLLAVVLSGRSTLPTHRHTHTHTKALQALRNSADNLEYWQRCCVAYKTDILTYAHGDRLTSTTTAHTHIHPLLLRQ